MQKNKKIKEITIVNTVTYNSILKKALIELFGKDQFFVNNQTKLWDLDPYGMGELKSIFYFS